MAQPPLYLVSGLGADERLFQFLRLDHPAPRIIRWVPPAPQDTMATYAGKLIEQIEPSQEPPVLLGLSFGGMIIQEIAKQIPVKRLILLSSLVDTRQLGWHYRLAGFLRLQTWLPFNLAKHWTTPGAWLFGARSAEEKQIFKSIIQDTDLLFLRWSLTQILRWRNLAPVAPAVCIHGDQDKILPVPHFQELHVVKGGEHLIVLSRATEVSALVNQYLH